MTFNEESSPEPTTGEAAKRPAPKATTTHTASHKRKKPSAASSTICHEIMQMSKEEFLAALTNFDAAINDSHKSLDALEGKVLHDVRSWFTEYKIQAQREARVRHKEKRLASLQAIYEQKNDKLQSVNTSCFTSEATMALLDSGVLEAKEIGKLFLLTGKFFVSDLLRDKNYLWKQIFEAHFGSKQDRGLSALYQSHKFKQVLDCKGYEWVFRSLFTVYRDDSLSQRLGAGPSVQADRHTLWPAPVLDCQNIFFMTFFETTETDNDARQLVSTFILDNDEAIEDSLGGENVSDLIIPISSKFGHHIKNHLEEHSNGGLHFTTFAVRTDTMEFACIERTTFDEIEFDAAGACVKSFSTSECVALTNVGENLAMRYFLAEGSIGPEDLSNGDFSFYFDTCDHLDFYRFEILLGMSGHSNYNSDFRSTDLNPSPGLDIFRILDYGIDWDSSLIR